MSESQYKQNDFEGGGLPRKTGMTVPEGYFESFADKMMAQIPQEEPKVVEMPRRTFWQSVRPYVYMAAMFAGIWLMMNMFTIFSPVNNGLNSSSSQSLLADVTSLQSESYFTDYMSSVSDYDLYDDLYDAGFDIPEF